MTLSLLRILIRSMNMTGSATRYSAMIPGAAAGRESAAAAYWEGRVALDSDVAQLRRGDLDALSTLARNLAIDHLRRVRPESLDEPIGDGAQGETAATRLPSREQPPIEGILQRERSQRLGVVLEMLPVVQREVLTLRFEEEMKIEEIAEVLGAPLSTVKTRLRRALERLRVTMETSYPGENWL